MTTRTKALGVLALGFVLFVSATIVTRVVAAGAPLFAQPEDVPSVSESAASPQWTPAVDRARSIVRAAIVEQNLPGVSIAVGIAPGVVWAEGFGWRDVETRTPVTPQTRFNIGTAAPIFDAAAVASLGMTNTGTDSAADWSPRHTGEPEEDAPPLTFIHDVILRPIGIADPAKPLPGERATFYVPGSDDNNPRHGRRLMYMRDLACCAAGKAFYSTPADLVRFALATKVESINGKLADGSVMSLLTRHEHGLVVAVTSNIAYADTAALALKVADAFLSGSGSPAPSARPLPSRPSPPAG